MQQERRSGLRSRLPEASVVYESAHHEPRDAELFDLGTGGLFIPAVTPLPRGTRLALEIRLSRGGSAWPALGRVVWTRATAGAGRPSGMGVKIVDIDAVAVAAIERAIGPAPPARERTVRGIGVTTPPAAWVANGRQSEREGPRRVSGGAETSGRLASGKKRRAAAAALLAAAIAAGMLGVMQGRGPVPWLQGRVAAAGTLGTAIGTTPVAQPLPPASGEAAPAVLPSPPLPGASAPPASAAASAVVPPHTPPPATRSKVPSRPAAWRAWSAGTVARSGKGASDNPY